MAKKHIKSGPQIIEEFLATMEADTSIDRNTITAIGGLWKQNKLNANRLQQELYQARQVSFKDG